MIRELKRMLLPGILVISMILGNLGFVSLAEEGNEYIIDDVDERFVYSEGDANHGGWESWTDGSGKPEVTEHWSNTAGATLDISFSGTKIELYGKADPTHAMFSVSIDGEEAVEVDAYAAVRDVEKKLYESQKLSEGEHVAHITVLEKRNPACTGKENVYGVQFVYAKVFSNNLEEPKFPGYTDIDDAVVTTSGEAFKFQYEPSGVWHAESGYPALFLGGTDHYSDKSSSGEFYTMNFLGTGIEIYGSKNPEHADCDVYIDGVLEGIMLSEGTSVAHQQKLFEKKDLENGNHILKVVKRDSGKAAQVDMVRVFHEDFTATAIALNRKEVSLGTGQTAKLKASIEPWFVNMPEIIWTSEDETVAMVSEEGVIKAMSEKKAETTVTATVKGSDVSASVKVIVDPAIQAVKAYIGNEKLLETQEDYEALLDREERMTLRKSAWKGDILNSKIVVLSKNDEVHQAEVTASDFTTEEGDIISADHIEIKWLKEVKANDGRNMAGVVKSYPDMIHAGGTMDIAAETAKFAWVNIKVPKDTKPGIYTGIISVNAAEVKSPIELSYTVEVLNLVQPKPEATEIQVWQHPFSVANYYLGLGENLTGGICNEAANDFYFTEEHFNLMRASMEEYASIGGHDAVANIVEEAWNHQSFYGDPSMVKWTKKTDGTWEFDYRWYDAWIHFMIDCGVINPEEGIGQIKCYSIVPWNNQIAYYDEASGKTVKSSLVPGSSEWKTVWEAFLSDFMEHSKENGWFEITYISMDERGLDQLEPAVDIIESVQDEEGKSFKISSALNYAAPEYYDFTDRIEDISINLGNIKGEAQMRELSEHRRERGLTTTYYSCTGDYPTNYTISDPGDNYWTILYSMTFGTDGFMRWAWDNYVYDMHEDITYRYWEPGDGWFIYPLERDAAIMSETVPFYSTPRYELFKQGIRDAAKAKYLMARNAGLNDEINRLMMDMKRPKRGTHNGSAVAANETERMLVHSETEHVYERMTELAREYAKENAEEAIDREDLTALIEYAKEAKKAESYNYLVPKVKALFQKALSDAIDINEIAITQAEIDAAYEALLAKVHLLDFTGNPATLKSLVDIASGKVEKLYTKESWVPFAKALANAKEALEDKNTLQAELDGAHAALQTAMDGLVENPIDKSKLEKLAGEASVYEEKIGNYVPESTKGFAAALGNARDVLKSDEASQGDIDSAYKVLLNAIFGLREKPNKDKLEGLLHKVEVMDLSVYSAKTAASVKAAYAEAVAVFEDENADQKEVDAAVAALEEAVKVASDHAGSKINTTGKTTKKTAGNTAAKTGDSKTAVIPVAVGLAAILAAIIAWKKK